MCGGTWPTWTVSGPSSGLSPRVRGNPQRGRPHHATGGSIPACAGEPTSSAASTIHSGVYPRVCGGTSSAVTIPCAATGLSPRVRGNHPRTAHDRAHPGSIPACAGEPSSAVAAASRSSVYPRVCGGTLVTGGYSDAGWGLSPRVRGNRARQVPRLHGDGSIPACAGEPSCRAGRTTSRRVYPRVCGGTLIRPGTSVECTGLSPRVRGNRLWAIDADSAPRSIPACAGEPCASLPTSTAPRVYPRVCGGTARSAQHAACHQGLSPRVRGNLGALCFNALPIGSIPACAGEPPAALLARPLLWVYPRVCGGTMRASHSVQRVAGLSPRVRGNRYDVHDVVLATRSIPACAGEPSTSSAPARTTGVYPRVCGGTVSVGERVRHKVGLSPRVRGNPQSGSGSATARWSIPACAGEPLARAGYNGGPGVYPRVCGGTWGGVLVAIVGGGLSPRVRGNHSGIVGCRYRRGSIPACAGEPGRSTGEHPPLSVYPRVCGGTMKASHSVQRLAGLSPRVRGNHLPGRYGDEQPGSIPACAGEPLSDY